MGVDLKGQDGTWFRNNWWWWRPLAGYCFEVAPQVCGASNHFRQWTTNDGSMTAQEALTLHAILETELASGRTKAYAKQYQRQLEDSPDVECSFCHGTGKRWRTEALPTMFETQKFIATLGDKEGITEELKRLMREHHEQEVRDIFANPGPIECNGCDGYGKRRPNACDYPFSADNVREFSAWLKHCNGFEVL